MNESGNFGDVAEFMRVALGLGITIVIVILLISNFGSNIRSMDNSTIPMVVKNSTVEMESYSASGFDFLFLFVYLIFLAFSVVMARFIPSSSKFILISVFALFLLPFCALIVENVWSGFVGNAIVSGVVDTFTFLPFMMDNLVWLVTFYSFAVAVALLTKEEVGG